MLNAFKPYRLGFLIGGVYLLVAVPCACMHWYELSIPAMIVYFLSLPALWLFPIFKFFGVPSSDGWIFRIYLITTQAIIYFLLAEGLSYLIRKIFSIKPSGTAVT